MNPVNVFNHYYKIKKNEKNKIKNCTVSGMNDLQSITLFRIDNVNNIRAIIFYFYRLVEFN